MLETIPANNIGQEEMGYVLLALLSDNAQSQITNLLGDLDRELPDTLWCMPPNALHITLCEIYQPKDYGQDKTSLFEQNKQQYEDAARKVLADFSKIAVNFNAIEASTGAIIVRGQDDGSFNAIRAQLVERLPLPVETKRPPDIVHSSIARYTKAVSLDEVRRAVAGDQIDFSEEVTEFKLVRCTVQPLLKYEVMQTYPLT
jgi:2'-5' RNA ligase